MIWIITIFLFIIFLFGLSKKIKFSNYFFYGENLKKLKTKLGLFFVLAMIILFIYVLLLTNIKFRTLQENIFTSKKKEIYLALDISGSMRVSDVQPNRIIMAKKTLENILRNTENAKFGLILFADNVFKAIELTEDKDYIKSYLDEIDLNNLCEGGTNFNNLFSRNVINFSDESAERSLIILSDWEDFSNIDFDKIKKIKSQGIKIIGYGIGTKEGGYIPTFGSKYKKTTDDFEKDANGRYILSKLNDNLMKKICDEKNNIHNKINSNTIKFENENSRDNFNSILTIILCMFLVIYLYLD